MNRICSKLGVNKTKMGVGRRNEKEKSGGKRKHVFLQESHPDLKDYIVKSFREKNIGAKAKGKGKKSR